jgi:hypothetical protein
MILLDLNVLFEEEQLSFKHFILFFERSRANVRAVPAFKGSWHLPIQKIICYYSNKALRYVYSVQNLSSLFVKCMQLFRKLKFVFIFRRTTCPFWVTWNFAWPHLVYTILSSGIRSLNCRNIDKSDAFVINYLFVLCCPRKTKDLLSLNHQIDLSQYCYV